MACVSQPISADVARTCVALGKDAIRQAAQPQPQPDISRADLVIIRAQMLASIRQMQATAGEISKTLRGDAVDTGDTYGPCKGTIAASFREVADKR